MYKLRTIDVWDTLLRRDCHPECIKLATAHHLLLGWRDQIKSEFRDGWGLYRARLEAERTLAVRAKAGGKDDEYEITEVLAQWFAAIFADTVPPDLPNRLAEFEISVEVDRSFADSDIVEFLRSHEAEKTLFLSDFYMSGEMLRRLLSAKGLNTLVAEGMSSCDVGLNKRSGQIFRHVHSIHAISPQDHVHIGDNEWSDVSSPRALGVNAIHFLPESAHAERLAREHLFSSRETLFEHISCECADMAQDASRGLSTKQASALYLGIQASPLFIGFALWIAEQAVLQKLDRLYFFTREGEFFHKVFCTIFPQGRLFGHDLPAADILEVSRLSTFVPSMKGTSILEMSRIWSLFGVQSVSGLFVTLGLDIEKFSDLLETLHLRQDDVISNPENSPELKQLFETPAFTDALKGSISNQSSLLQEYLKQSGMTTGRVGIVDIGWRGTIQDNIALLLPNTNLHGLYLGLRKFINVQPSNTDKVAYGPDENKFRAEISMYSNFAIMEWLCSSVNGSVLGYCMHDGCAKPRRYVDQAENTAFDEFVGPFQQGVLIAAQHWQLYLERYAVSSKELHTVALHLWDKLSKEPDEGLVDVYMRTPQQDLFGYGEIFNRSLYPSLSTIFLSPLLPSRRRSVVDFVRRVQWPEVIKKSNNLGYIHRSMLLVVFQLAQIIKRSRFKSWFLNLLQ
jgi:FMN phosphatase YigB (HAD superfamily)